MHYIIIQYTEDLDVYQGGERMLIDKLKVDRGLEL